MMRRVWILFGTCLLCFSGWFHWIRAESSSLYFFYGDEYDNFTGVAQYYLYDANGEQLFPIEGADYAGDWPYFDLMWAPNGQYFFEADAETGRVFVLSWDGKQRRVIEGVPYAGFYNIEQGIAPDHNSLATVLIDDQYMPNIAIFSMQGDFLRKINLLQPNFSAPNIFWSPDGEWIYAQLCERVNDETLCGLYRVQPDGSNWTRLSQTTFPDDTQSFTWSPDGKKIIFTAESALWLGTLDIEYAEYRISRIETLFHDDNNRSAPGFAWSPNSQWIIYQTDRNTLKRLAITADSSSEIFLSTSQQINLLWSDNNWVYYWAYEEYYTYVADLYRVPLTGGSPQLIFADGVKGKDWDYNLPLVVDDDWLIIAQQIEDNPISFYRLRKDGTHQERIFDSASIRPNSVYYTPVYRLSPDKQWVLVGSRDYAVEISYQFKIDDGQAVDFRKNSKPHRYKSIYMDPSPVVSMPYEGWGFRLGGLVLALGMIQLVLFRQKW